MPKHMNGNNDAVSSIDLIQCFPAPTSHTQHQPYPNIQRPNPSIIPAITHHTTPSPKPPPLPRMGTQVRTIIARVEPPTHVSRDERCQRVAHDECRHNSSTPATKHAHPHPSVPTTILATKTNAIIPHTRPPLQPPHLPGHDSSLRPMER